MIKTPLSSTFLTLKRIALVCTMMAGMASVALHSAPVKLNPPASSGSGMDSLVATPDSAKAVMLGDPDNDGVKHFYSVAIGGGTATQLTSTYVASGSLGSSRVTADSARLIFLGKLSDPLITELYSVPVSGGTTLKLNANLPANSFVRDFLLSPNGTRAFYRADQNTFGINELFSTPVTGGVPTRLNANLPTNGAVFDYIVSPDSSWVVYRASQDSQDFVELYSVPAGGGTTHKLNGTLSNFGSILASQFGVSPDNSRVVFVVRSQFTLPPEVHSAPIDGSGSAVSLTGAMPAFSFISGFRITSDSSRVVYLADQDTDSVLELYSVPITGGTPIKVSGTLVAGGSVDPGSYRLTPDGSRVIYIADQTTDSVFELFSASVLGGSVVKLNGTMASNRDVQDFAISADGARVVYTSDEGTDGVLELYSVPVAGGSPVKLNGTLVSGGAVNGFALSADGASVLYRADQDTDNLFEIYLVPIAGGTPEKINGSLAGSSQAGGFSFSPNSQYALYLAAQDTAGVSEAYSVNIAPTTPYGAWAASKSLTAGVNDGFGDDPNLDGLTNIEHFAFDSDPLGASYTEGKVVTRIITSASNKYISITFPVRNGAVWDANGGVNSTLTVDGIVYTIRGDANLEAPTDAPVGEWTPAQDSGLPTLSAGYSYRTFYVTNSVAAATAKAFLQIDVAEVP